MPSSLTKHPIAVIGGGVVGACCAFFLRQAGFAVVLIEKETTCSGASFGNLGLLAASHSLPLAAPGAVAKAMRWLFMPDTPFQLHLRPNADLIEWLCDFYRASNPKRAVAALGNLAALNLASIRLYEKFVEAGWQFGFERRGTLELFSSQKALSEARESAVALRRAGLNLRILTSEEVLRIEPLVQPGIAGGVFFADDCHIQPLRFVSTVTAHATAAGVVLLENTPLTGFVVETGVITQVKTAAGDWEVSAVVLAAGTASVPIARLLGVNLPIQAGRGYSFDVPRTDLWPERPIMLAEAKVLLTPMNDVIRIGGVLDLIDPTKPASESRARSLFSRLPEYLSRSFSCDGAKSWSGLRPCTADGLPIIGWSQRVKNLFYATGHGMLGLTQGPATGKLVAQAMCREEPTLNVASFSPIRLSPTL